MLKKFNSFNDMVSRSNNNNGCHRSVYLQEPRKSFQVSILVGLKNWNSIQVSLFFRYVSKQGRECLFFRAVQAEALLGECLWAGTLLSSSKLNSSSQISGQVSNVNR